MQLGINFDSLPTICTCSKEASWGGGGSCSCSTDIFIVPQRRMHKSLKCCTYIIIRARERARAREGADMFQLARQLMGQVRCETEATQAKVIRLVILGCDKCSYRPDVITFSATAPALRYAPASQPVSRSSSSFSYSLILRLMLILIMIMTIITMICLSLTLGIFAYICMYNYTYIYPSLNHRHHPGKT